MSLLALWVPSSCLLLPLWKVTLQGDCGRSCGLCLRPRPAAGSVTAALLLGTGLFLPGQSSLLLIEIPETHSRSKATGMHSKVGQKNGSLSLDEKGAPPRAAGTPGYYLDNCECPPP